MINRPNTKAQRLHRHKRVRGKVSGTPERPRLNVFRSETNIYAQIIDDTKGVTLVSASSLEKGFEGSGSNCEAAKKVGEAIAERAKEELGDSVSEWPIHIDVPVYAASENQKNMQLAMKKSIEDAIGEYVVIDLQFLEGNSSVYYSSFYNQPTGEDNSIDLVFGAGWGPDYGDPLTYLHCFDVHDGDMLNYSGINIESQGQSEEQKAVLETLGLNEVQEVVDQATAATGDERIELFAKAEAMRLTNGILRPYATSGANISISKVKPFTVGYGLYGQAAYNQVPYFKYMQLLDEPVTAAEYEAAKEAWMAGK